MQIHDLNTKALTDPAYVAFDDGTDTYKTEFNEVVANAAASAVADADLTENTVAFTSGDAASPTAWTAVDVLTSGLSLKTLFNRISTMVKNVRYIWNKIGTASMGTTATTITGAIAEHESDISTLNSKLILFKNVQRQVTQNNTSDVWKMNTTFPPKSGYSRVIVGARSNNQECIVTGWNYDNNGEPQWMVRKLASGSVANVTYYATLLYIPDVNLWN